MKTEGQIRQKLKQVLFRHRKELLQNRLCQLPCNCKHNFKIHLPSEFLAEYADLQVCGFQKEGWRGITCDPRISEDLENAETCVFFEPELEPTELKDQFQEFVDNSTIAELAGRYPDAGALRWVLEDDPTEDVMGTSEVKNHE